MSDGWRLGRCRTEEAVERYNQHLFPSSCEDLLCEAILLWTEPAVTGMRFVEYLVPKIVASPVIFHCR